MIKAKYSILVLLPVFALACGGSLEKFDRDGGSGEDTDNPDDAAGEVPPDIVTDLPFDFVPDINMDNIPDPVVDYVPDIPVDSPVDIPADNPVDTLLDTTPSGCASGSNSQVFAGGGMVGCAGSVYWSDRDTLCASGWHTCSASGWVERRGGVNPMHNYWTSDALRYNGWDTGNCWVQLEGGNRCAPESAPMRVCAGNNDPEGNRCNWYNCGFNTAEPNEFFGGCNGNFTAGALCCR